MSVLFFACLGIHFYKEGRLRKNHNYSVSVCTLFIVALFTAINYCVPLTQKKNYT
jgi:hypothetical protein